MHCQCMQDFRQPLAAELRPDMTPAGSEVILEVSAAGICHTDLHVREGGFDLGNGKWLSYADRGVTPPLVLGHETAGTIVAAGPDCPELDQGKTYVVYPWCGCGDCTMCSEGKEQLCFKPEFLGFYRDGGFATHMRVPHHRHLFDIGGLDPDFAAPLACSGLTTYSALKKVSATLGTAPALIIGAGGLGLMSLQIMKAFGALPPVVADIDPAKRQAALNAGAAAAVDPRAGDVLAQIKKACDGLPLAVLDYVGSEATADLAFNAVARGGAMVIVGLFGGAASWPLPVLAAKSVTIHGCYTGSLPEFSELMELARGGALSPIPITNFPLEEASNAMDQLEKGEVIGRAILKNS